MALLVDNPLSFLRNAVLVLIGKKTWVGYCPLAKDDKLKLPAIKKGVFNPASNLDPKVLEDAEFVSKLNLLYARDYTVWKDLEIFFKAISKH